MKNKRKYDISIIIPVYNCEEYIEECFNSLLSQSYEFGRIQVIMIDDGSKDNSFKVCNELKGSYDNVIAITKENGGVSSTRNLGMSLAEGEYILFLDADDFLSNNAIRDIVAFFDAHYDEVDIVTYPLYYVYAKSIKPHFRYRKYFEFGTAVYDMNETPYSIQCTVNVVVKNGLGVLFDEAKTFAEDEKFCTECIMLKYKLGYVDEARYYYRKTSISAASTKTNPIYTFDDTMNYYGYLFDKYKENGKVKEYVQCLYLNNFRWRFNGRELLPTYLDEAGYKDAYNRLMHLVNQLDPKMILETPYMSKGQQAVLLKLKGEPVEYKVDKKGNVTITVAGVEYPFATLSVNIFRSKLIGKELRLVGILDHVCLTEINFDFSIDIEYVSGETKKIHPELKISQRYSLFLQDEIAIPKQLFDVKICIENVRSIAFNISVMGNEIPARLRFYRFASHRVTYGTNNIVYSKRERKLINKKANLFTRINPFYRLSMETDKEIWLYNDRNGVFDNAYYQFLHDLSKADGVERYYIYNDELKEITDKFEGVDKKQLVKYKSKKHIELFMKSAKIITSFSDIAVYCPLGRLRLRLYGNIHYELVYLQHGILYANLRKMYTKENTDIDKFVVSSDFEIKNLTENYNYKREDLIEGGMPRLAAGKNESPKAAADKRKILLAPSWRANLTGPLVNGTRVLDIPNFTSSEFYKRMQEFLNCEALSELLERFDLTLDLKLHPNFAGYEDLFTLESSRISIGFGNIKLEDYSLFITDFSSFQFDFINLSRPILYFIPDITEFRAGLHTYNKLEMSSEDLFGPMSYDIDETVENMKEIINNDFRVSQPYDKRMKEFFNIADDPCEAIYQAIK